MVLTLNNILCTNVNKGYPSIFDGRNYILHVLTELEGVERLAILGGDQSLKIDRIWNTPVEQVCE